ncbi:MAG: 2-hydroxyacyl-CoA dehydratase subunit D [Bacillota bacterium]
MSDHNTFLEMRQIYLNRHAWTSQQKSLNKIPRVGFICRLTPVELILASRAIPVELFGERKQPLSAGAYMESNVCPFARNILDDALIGRYGYLDAVIVPHSCDVVTKIIDFWKAYVQTPPVYQIWIPHVVSDHAVAGLKQELYRMAEWFTRTLGLDISSQSLRTAIQVINTSRRLLRQLHRGCQEGKVQGSEFLAAALSRGIIAPEQWNQMVAGIVETLNDGKMGTSAVRLLLSAAAMEDFQVIDTVEKLGGSVVLHEYCDGYRSCRADILEEGDPWLQVASHYVRETLCPRFYQPGLRLELVREMVSTTSVDGAIAYALANCDCYQFEEMALTETLEGLGIPTISLHTNYEAQQNEQMFTRLEAFFEIVQGGSKTWQRQCQ